MKTLIKDFFTGWKSILLSFRESRRDELRKPVMRFIWGRYAWMKYIGCSLIIIITCSVGFTMMLSKLNLSGSNTKLIILLELISILGDPLVFMGLLVGYMIHRYNFSEFHDSQIKIIPEISFRLFSIIYLPVWMIFVLIIFTGYISSIYVWFSNKMLHNSVGLLEFMFGLSDLRNFKLENLINIFLERIWGIFEFIQGIIKLFLIIFFISMTQSKFIGLLKVLLVLISFMIWNTFPIIIFYFLYSGAPELPIIILYIIIFVIPGFLAPGFIWKYFQKRFIRMHEVAK